MKQQLHNNLYWEKYTIKNKVSPNWRLTRADSVACSWFNDQFLGLAVWTKKAGKLLFIEHGVSFSGSPAYSVKPSCYLAIKSDYFDFLITI